MIVMSRGCALNSVLEDKYLELQYNLILNDRKIETLHVHLYIPLNKLICHNTMLKCQMYKHHLLLCYNSCRVPQMSAAQCLFNKFLL